MFHGNGKLAKEGESPPSKPSPIKGKGKEGRGIEAMCGCQNVGLVDGEWQR